MKTKLLPLTSLRFFAAFFVLLSHLSFIKESDNYSFLFVEDGFVGVTFFFILSGFILTYSYEDRFINKLVSKKRYFISRIARIYPLHLLTLLVSMPLVLFSGSKNILPIIPNLLLVQAWIPIKSIYFSGNSPSWSISSEMFFYLLLPFFIFLRTRTIIVLFLLLIVVQVLCISVGVGERIEHALIYISPFFRVSDFILGIIIYKIWKLSPSIFTKHAGIAQYASIILLIVFIFLANYFSIEVAYKYSLFYLIPMSLVILAFAYNGGLLGSFLSNKYLVLLGESSFAFYLVHHLIIRYLVGIERRLGYFSETTLLLCVFIGSISLSIILYKYFEKPAQKYFNRVFS